MYLINYLDKDVNLISYLNNNDIKMKNEVVKKSYNN